MKNESSLYPAATEVLIIGAGAAGAYYAAQLASAGKTVTVLESGPAWELRDLYSSQIWARRLKWGGPAVERSGTHAIGHNMATGWGLGGAALHHYAGWPRLHENDFNLHSAYGRGLDWPIAYSDLRPYYDKIQTEIGVSGDSKAETWRPPAADYPMPPMPNFPHSAIIARGFNKLGLHTAATPAAINTTTYNDRPACIYDGWCDAGCPIQALANPLVTHIPQARKAGAQFITGVTVSRLLMDKKNRVSGAEYFDASGNVHNINATLVILAASAIQNPRILLNSANNKFPNGLANRSGLVGHYFSCHSISSVYGIFTDETHNYLGVPTGQLICQDHYDNKKQKNSFGSYMWGIGTALKPNDILGIAMTRPDLFGAKLHTFMQQAAQHMGTMSSVNETLAQKDNRVELSKERDVFGIPRAHVVHSLHKDSANLWQTVNQQGLEIFKAAGSEQSWNGPLVTAHVLGGTIMGKDPRSSVTDSYGHTHDIPNLIIAGGGLFPSVGAVSPTFSLYALAARSVEHLLKNYRDYAS
ncbi:MAG: GMC family oxidoreductase [Gammaproteobacteria bacterium]|nr:GMC family oxidoreductase [Gammaproteobacteria bacterium]